MTRYIQRHGGGYLETVDSLASSDFPTARAFWKELARLVREYRLSDPSGAYYSSRRACKAWG